MPSSLTFSMLFMLVVSAVQADANGVQKPQRPIEVKISDKRPEWERHHCVAKAKPHGGAKKAVFFPVEDFRPSPLEYLRTELELAAAQANPAPRRVKVELLSFQVVYKETPDVQTAYWEESPMSPPRDLLARVGPDLTCTIQARVTVIWPDKRRQEQKIRGTMNSGYLDPRGYRATDVHQVIVGATADFLGRWQKALDPKSAVPTSPDIPHPRPASPR